MQLLSRAYHAAGDSVKMHEVEARFARNECANHRAGGGSTGGKSAETVDPLGKAPPRRTPGRAHDPPRSAPGQASAREIDHRPLSTLIGIVILFGFFRSRIDWSQSEGS